MLYANPILDLVTLALHERLNIYDKKENAPLIETKRLILRKFTDSDCEDINNPKSGNVMQRLGMIYSHSYDELWQPKNIRVTFNFYKINFSN